MSYEHLYVHVPFCRRRCSYCDFSIAVRPRVPSEQFVDAVLSELAFRAPDVGIGKTTLRTVYLGGGTPSLLPLVDLERLITSIRDTWRAPGALDVTIEANPDDVDTSVAHAWRDVGINRVSLGVQSLGAQALEWMHRTHTASEALAAVDALRDAGIQSVSADVMFGLPSPLDADPCRDTERLIDHGVSHVSAYGLTLEPSTALAKWKRQGAIVQSDEESFARQFLELHNRLTDRGFEHYEVSNYALPGHRSAHNRAYWSGASFLGLGPSAHSHADGHRWWNVRPWAEYERVVGAKRDPTAGSERLDASQRWLETVYLALRTDRGLSAVNARRLRAEDVGKLVESGHLSRDSDGTVRATPAGWLCLDEVVSVLTTSGEGG